MEDMVEDISLVIHDEVKKKKKQSWDFITLAELNSIQPHSGYLVLCEYLKVTQNLP